MASNKKSFLLRLDPKLWAELEALAAQELRSVNAQIEYLLREGLAKHRRFIPPPDPTAPEDE
ncbi:toxin-antitoxin system HicB family antitoxin [Massilia sp. TS11]|uniref:toxin-antitoxin system HicB family antitoxin n=1 Tax=Massilia sp. TS11 TaxID=2908003 RepID=UPI001EDAA78F|nr:toxin-antitoxin system HicB family antitoxin [Massilia sp. TS11]MCG2586060.1 toxin-antitoxin system HicB family antitoxin [Massilia sp. TS11]